MPTIEELMKEARDNTVTADDGPWSNNQRVVEALLQISELLLDQIEELQDSVNVLESMLLP